MRPTLLRIDLLLIRRTMRDIATAGEAFLLGDWP
jgi:hypothetical protein